MNQGAHRGPGFFMRDQKMSAGDLFADRKQMNLPTRTGHLRENFPGVVRVNDQIPKAVQHHDGRGDAMQTPPRLDCSAFEGMKEFHVMRPFISLPRRNSPGLGVRLGGRHTLSNMPDHSAQKEHGVRRKIRVEPTEKYGSGDGRHAGKRMLFRQGQSQGATQGETGDHDTLALFLHRPQGLLGTAQPILEPAAGEILRIALMTGQGRHENRITASTEMIGQKAHFERSASVAVQQQAAKFRSCHESIRGG